MRTVAWLEATPSIVLKSLIIPGSWVNSARVSVGGAGMPGEPPFFPSRFEIHDDSLQQVH